MGSLPEALHVRLQFLSGDVRVDHHNWSRYVVKGLAENALEAVEGTGRPAVTIRLRRVGRGHGTWIPRVEVGDNGPGIPAGALEKIAGVRAFGGTKRHYALLTRGMQGNALMTIIGIQSLADGGGPLQIETRGTACALPVDESVVDAVPVARVEFSKLRSQGARGDFIYWALCKTV